MKPKKVVLIGMAVCTISVLLMSPALANGDDYVLGIYGNANEDDTIDMRDLTYVKLIFFGKTPETELADAKYDGKINPLDFIQIKLIIVGKVKELTIIDDTITDTFPGGKPVTVKKPVNSIITLHSNSAEILKLLKSKDKIVGIDKYITDKKFFPDISKLPIVGSMANPDVEKILSLDPDIVIAYGSYFTKWTIDLEEKLKGTDIILVRLDCYKPETMSHDIIKLGYILDKEIEAVEFIDWHEEYLSTINDRVEKLTEDKKPRVYVEGYTDYKTYSRGAGAHQACVMAGGINIASDLSGSYPKVDPEWVMVQNPEVIVKVASSTSVSGGYGEDDASEMKAVWDAIMNRPELANVTAVRDEKVYLIHAGGTWNDPKYFIGLIYLGKWFHPDLFEDLDPKAIHQEYLTEFQGLDYDLDKHGVFVYPPLED